MIMIMLFLLLMIMMMVIKILFMTSEHSCREPEVGVKCCMNNFSKSVYCKVVI